MARSNQQSFGGDWTEQKLEVLKGYLQAYTTALKNQSFTKLYVDAFAGTGYRELKAKSSDSTPLFQELSADEPQEFLEGSARIALQTDPAFDEFIFIEADSQRADELRKIKDEFPNNQIEVQQGDANKKLQDLCQALNWHQYRAVLFLDPFGMQVDWETMKAVARTEAIDTWILFPLGVGVNRLLTKNPQDIPKSWAARLDSIFGTSEWKNHFYDTKAVDSGLFDQEAPAMVEQKQATFESIGRFYSSRLEEIFASVAPNPKNLLNSTNNPIYQLHFAAGNPRGGPIALNIAKHLLEQV